MCQTSGGIVSVNRTFFSGINLRLLQKLFKPVDIFFSAIFTTFMLMQIRYGKLKVVKFMRSKNDFWRRVGVLKALNEVAWKGEMIFRIFRTPEFAFINLKRSKFQCERLRLN